jgi:hypothetical protein
LLFLAMLWLHRALKWMAWRLMTLGASLPLRLLHRWEGFYRCFVRDFSTIATLLHELTKSGVLFHWDQHKARLLSDPGPRGCVHQGVRIGLGDRTCPVPYLYCILPACGVELVDTEGNYSSCTRVRFLS